MQTFEEYCEYFIQYIEPKDKELSEKIHDLMLRKLPRAICGMLDDYRKERNDTTIEPILTDFWGRFC